MPAATTPFTAHERPIGFVEAGLAAGAVIFAGTLVSLNAAGNAIPAADTASTRVLGRAESSVDNTGGAAGAKKITIKRGVFCYSNSATNPVTIASLGLPVYVEDDTTVAVAAGPTNDIKAGVCVGIDQDGVWVDTTLAPAI